CLSSSLPANRSKAYGLSLTMSSCTEVLISSSIAHRCCRPGPRSHFRMGVASGRPKVRFDDGRLRGNLTGCAACDVWTVVEHRNGLTQPHHSPHAVLDEKDSLAVALK